MRGSSIGALTRSYLHSGITESLWYAVAESERLFTARLLHATMGACLYGNPAADLDKGNESVHRAYLNALGAVPYLSTLVKRARRTDTEELVEEWRKANEGPVTANGKEGGNV